MYTKLDEGFLDFFSKINPFTPKPNPVQPIKKSVKQKSSKQRTNNNQSSVNPSTSNNSSKPDKKDINPYYNYTKNLFDSISEEAVKDGWSVSSSKIESKLPKTFNNSLVLKKDDRILSVILPYKDYNFSYYIYDNYEVDGDITPTTTSFKSLSELRKDLTDKLNPNTDKYQPDYQHFTKKFNELSSALKEDGWKIEKNQVQRLNTDKAFNNQLSISKNNKILAYRVTISKDKIVNKTNKNYTVGVVDDINTQKSFNKEVDADDYFDVLTTKIDNTKSDSEQKPVTKPTNLTNINTKQQTTSDKNKLYQYNEDDHKYFLNKFNSLSSLIKTNGWSVNRKIVYKANQTKNFENSFIVSKGGKSVSYKVKYRYLSDNAFYKVTMVQIENENSTIKFFDEDEPADTYFRKLIMDVNKSTRPSTIKELLIQRKHNATTSNR